MDKKNKFTLVVISTVMFFLGCSQNKQEVMPTKLPETANTDQYIPISTTEINQWYLNNDGSFHYTNYYGSAWLTSSPTTIPGYDIGINNIKNIFISKRKSIISVIDTNVDLNHYAYNNIWTNIDEIQNNNIDDDNNGHIDDFYGLNFCTNSTSVDLYHGTFIIGELCAEDISSNYTSPLNGSDYQVMCLPAISQNDSDSINHIIEAISYAELNCATICCLSFSTNEYNQELYNTIANSSMLFIVAAGNEGLDLDNNNYIHIYPAEFDLDNIIVVTDMRSDGKLSDTANYGNKSVDVAAPGTDYNGTVI